MRNSAITLLCLAATLTAATAEAGPQRLDATVHHDPLRVVTDSQVVPLHRGKTFARQAIAFRLRAVLEAEGLDGRAVMAWVDQGLVRGVEVRTVADVSIVDDAGLGGEEIARRGAHTTLVVTGQVQASSGPGDSQTFYRVRLNEDSWGWVAASQVDLGTRSFAGELAGQTLAPLFAAGTDLRDARFFHPDGHTYRADVRSLDPDRFRETASRLEGHALIRLGLGMSRLEGDGSDEPWFDALSLAIRFYDPKFAPSSQARPGDQDLLLTAWAERFRHFFTRVLWTGTTADFLGNEYFPAMPFEVEGQKVWIRARPRDPWYQSAGDNRVERLNDAIANGHAAFILELQDGRPYSRRQRFRRSRQGLPTSKPWTPIVEIQFREQVDVDQDALHYHPGMAGRGLQPTGWIAQMRGAVYRASQDAREGSVEETTRTGIISGLDD